MGRVPCLLLALLVAGAAGAAPRVLHRGVRARDGARLVLYRYPPPAPALARGRVLLVGELGFGRALFDLDGAGLAPWLQARGWDVYVAELRGQGEAEAPAEWRLASWVEDDLAAVLEATGPGTLDLVAHGYGGALALAAAAGPLGARVRRVVALATPVQPEVPNAATEALLRDGGRLSRLALTPDGARTFGMLFARGPRWPGRRLERLRASARDLSGAAARDLLGWMAAGDAPLGDGRSLQRALAGYTRPTLLVLPLADNFAHPEYASPLARLAPRAPVRSLLLSRVDLLSEDYGHLSVLLGPRAEREVFGALAAFLEAGDAP